MAADKTSRCGSANNSCALTGVQSRENRIKWRRKPRNKGNGWKVLNRIVMSLTEQDWINQWSRSPAAVTGLWSFVCAPFIRHLCFLGNRGLSAGINTSSSYTATTSYQWSAIGSSYVYCTHAMCYILKNLIIDYPSPFFFKILFIFNINNIISINFARFFILYYISLHFYPFMYSEFCCYCFYWYPTSTLFLSSFKR